MRLSFFSVALLVHLNLTSSSIYDIKVLSLDGNSVSMSDFKGKKILIAAISPDNLKAGRLGFFDSLQVAYPDVVVIAVPASDFGGTQNTAIVDVVKKNMSKKIIVTSMSTVRKDKGASQDPLISWLTHASDNIHFDTDVMTDEQIYVVSESGILYSVMEKGVSIKLLDLILRQKDVTQ